MESKKTRDLCIRLKKCNALIFAVVGHRMQEPGWPDRYICHRRWCGWIEFKEHTIITLKQRLIIEGLRERGGHACVVRFVDDKLQINDGELFENDPLVLLEKLNENDIKTSQ